MKKKALPIELVTFGFIGSLIILLTLAVSVQQVHANLPNLGEAPELAGVSNWINSEPLEIYDLKGKVVLVDFWTYSCINCVRTFPHLNEWHDKYKDRGLVIIGVHTPEYDFEKNLTNLNEAVEKYGIKYPVVQDNDYKTWKAYGNQFWPQYYLIDKTGIIRYEKIGEGGYELTEKAIEELLG